MTCGAAAASGLVPAVPTSASTGAADGMVRFGPTDLLVSRLCQGTAFRQLPRADLPETRAVLYRCLDLGINFFDTSEAYGWGGSETLLGKVAAGRRDRIVICSKAAPSYAPGDDANPNKFTLGEKAVLTRDVLTRKCEDSLRRLETDYIDLYLIHSPDETTPPESLADSLDALVRAGKIRYWGVSNFSPVDVAQFISLSSRSGKTAIAGTEDYYSLISRDRDEKRDQLMPLISRSGLGLLAFSPLDTGRLAPDRPVRPGTAMARLVRVLDDVAHQLNATRPQVCIAWVLSHPAVTCCLAGAESPDHISDNVPGTRLVLPQDALRALNTASQAWRPDDPGKTD